MTGVQTCALPISEFINWRRTSDREVLKEAQLMVEQQIAANPNANNKVLAQKIDDLKLAEMLQTGNVELIKEASISTDPVSPKPVKYSIIAFIMSLIFGVVFVLFLNRFDTRVRDINEIEEKVKTPIIEIGRAACRERV